MREFSPMQVTRLGWRPGDVNDFTWKEKAILQRGALTNAKSLIFFRHNKLYTRLKRSIAF